MLYDQNQIPELNFMKHRHDDAVNYIQYENVILDKTLSPYIYENDLMNGFLKRLQPLVANIFDNYNIIKNFKNYMVHKYHYKQPG